MGWMVSLPTHHYLSPGSPLWCTCSPTPYSTLHLFLIPQTSPTSIPSLDFQLMIFCSIRKQKNLRRASSYFHYKLPTSTLKSTTDLNTCLPISMDAMSSHPVPHHDHLLNRTPTINGSFLANKNNPSFTSIFPFSYQPFLCSPLNKISSKTCHAHDLSTSSSSLKPSGILSLPISMGTLLTQWDGAYWLLPCQSLASSLY